MVDFANIREREPSPPVPAGVLEIPEGWEVLRPLRDEEWFRDLAAFLAKERAERPGGVLPPEGLELAALGATSLEDVRVVLLAQDPYPHDAAEGLAFSVKAGYPVGKTCAQSILSELEAEGYGLPPPGTFDLRPWAARGVLLLNATLTVRRSAPKSHALRGWEEFTGAVLQALRARDEKRWRAFHALQQAREELNPDDPVPVGPPPAPVVFLAMGSWARDLVTGPAARVRFPYDQVAHVPHPAAREGQFRGSRPFAKVNSRLAGYDAPPVDWSLSVPPPVPEEVVELVRGVVRACRKAGAGLDATDLSCGPAGAVEFAREALALAREAATAAGTVLKGAALEDARERLRKLAAAFRTHLRWLEAGGTDRVP